MLESSNPRDLDDASDWLRDEAYYLLMIAHHALVTGPKLVRQTGVPLPKLKTTVVVEKLRDVYEHWDLWHGPSTEPEHLRRWSKKKSGRYLAERYPRAFPRSYGGDEHHLDTIGGVLYMRPLREDLQYLSHVLGCWHAGHIEAISH